MTASKPGSSATGVSALASTLWRLREVLDQLLFKIFEAHLIMESGQTHWLAKASRELDSALQEVRHVEVMRAVDSVALADQLGLPPDVTLHRLSTQVPPPWDDIYQDHLEALRLLAGELEHAVAAPIPSPPPAAREPAPAAPAGLSGAVDDIDVDIVREFLVDTLTNARQVSLDSFLA